PSAVVAFYNGLRDRQVKDPPDRSVANQFAGGERDLVMNLLVASSFLAAWKEEAGDSPGRDWARDGCVILLAYLGVDPAYSGNCHRAHEVGWHDSFKMLGMSATGPVVGQQPASKADTHIRLDKRRGYLWIVFGG